MLSDDDVRGPAIAKVLLLRARFGGRVPRAALSEGIEVHGQRVPIWNYQKGIFKPAALGPDGAALSIQTSVESPYDDERDLEQGLISYKYRGRDPSHPDNAALRRAGYSRLPLIYLIAVDPGVYDVVAPVYVIEDAPASLQFLMVADQVTTNQGSVVEATLRREYVTRAVLQRLHQQHFRRSVLRAYRDQCAICRLRHLELLDAAHILPDRHPQGEPAVTNGLGLCKIHHSAYDANIIGIDAHARIHVREDVLQEKDGPMLEHGIQGVANTTLQLPRRVELRPNPEFLHERFQRFIAA